MNGTRWITGLLITGLVLLLMGLAGCTDRPEATLEGALSLYQQNKLAEALPLFEDLADRGSERAEPLVWLAETYRRLGRKADAVRTARRALELDPRSSFAHTVIAEALNPVLGEWSDAHSDTTWTHLLQAVECDSTDGHPWLVIFGEAIHRGDPAMAGRSLRMIVGSGFLTKAALSYGRWMLNGLPPDAILLTNGDMDTYPPCAVQETEGFRKDVVIVNRGTLETKWQARYLRDRVGVPLPHDDAWLDAFTPVKDPKGYFSTLSDSIFRGWIALKARGAFDRPIAVAVTVDGLYLRGLRENLRDAGAFLEWRPSAVGDTPDTVDTASMLEGLKGLKPEDFSGPWVSVRDRSPIRRMYTSHLVRNVTVTAIRCAERLIDAGRTVEAADWTGWADELDRTAETGPAFSGRIAGLRERLAGMQ